MRDSWKKPLAVLFVAGGLGAALPAVALAGVSPPPTPPSLGACQQRTVEAGIVKAEGCFTADSQQQTFTSTGEVDLNGFTVDPGGGGADSGASLAINVSTREITTSGKKVVLSAGTVSFSQAVALGFTAPTSGNLQIGNFAYAPSPDAGTVIVELLEQISGANVSVPVWLTPEAGRIDFTASLQSFFVLVAKEKSVQFSIAVEPEKGAVFEGVTLKADGVKLGALELETLDIEWSPSGTWGGTVQVKIPRGKSEIEVGGTLGFVNGKFNSLAVNVGGIHAPIGDGLYLEKLGGAFQLNPVQVAANVGIEWGETVRIGGRDVSLFALDGGLSLGFQQSTFYVRVVATMYLVGIQLANGSVDLWAGPSSSGAALSVSAGVGIPSFTNDPNQPTYVGLSLSGWIATAGGRAEYEVDGSGRIKVIGINLVQADAVISNVGMSACWTVVLRGGFGLRWGQPVQMFPANTCGIGAYQQARPSGAPSATSAGGRRRAIVLDHDVAVVRVRSRSALHGGPRRSPHFTLTHSSGRRLSTLPGTGSRGARRSDHAVMHDEENGQTFLQIKRAGGRWTLNTYEGSTPVDIIETASVVPRPRRVRAQVTGSGTQRTLRWSSERLGPHQLVFYEQLAGGKKSPILRTSTARGSYRFTPQQAIFGSRTLKVRIQHGGGPVGSRTLGRFRVDRPPRATRPTHVDAERRGNDVVVEFGPAMRATGYEIAVESARGRLRYERRVGPDVRRVVFARTARGGRTVAGVRGIDSLGGLGPARTIRLDDRVATSPAAAATRAARTAELDPNGLALWSSCPAGGEHCDLSVTVLRGTRRVGAASASLVPGLGDRVALALDVPTRRTLHAGGSVPVRVRATVVQGSRRATRTRAVTLRLRSADRNGGPRSSVAYEVER